MPAPGAAVILKNVTFKGPLGEVITTYAEFVAAYGEPPAQLQSIIDFIFGKSTI